MNETITIHFDGRLFILLIFFLFIIGALLIKTLNIWLQNFEYRQRLGIRENRNPASFIEWQLTKALKVPFIGLLLGLIMAFIIGIAAWFLYPRECFARLKEHFIKQYNSAKNYLLNRRKEWK